MKRKRFLTAIFSTGLIFATALTGCVSNRSGGKTELAQWAGTWNAMTNVLDDPGLNKTFVEGAAYIQYVHSKTITADGLKQVFAPMLRTDFKSCKIEGDTFTVYTETDLQGTATHITYTYKGESEGWHRFEGNQSGRYKYLAAYLPERDSTGNTAEHFHFRYGADGFDALEANPSWMATVMLKGTTIAQLAASLKEVIRELPWDLMLP
ncbi:MAG: ZinT/AdcA family metal-binding protein [Treponema sp.]|nr:ZinT/AdcA family metal-binding protein [Treponema sp.]